MAIPSAFVNNSPLQKRGPERACALGHCYRTLHAFDFRLLRVLSFCLEGQAMKDFTVELLPTTVDQAQLIRNLYQFYAYESSDWEQEDVDDDGRFYIHDEHLMRYWNDQDWSANLLLVNGCVAGFLLVERSELPGIDALELADLFILKRYRRKGIGKALVTQVLMGGHENWLVRYYRQDDAAVAFWDSVLEALPRPARAIELDDEPDLANFLITRVMH